MNRNGVRAPAGAIGLGLACLSLAGCSFLGPNAVRGGRVLYNRAIAETTAEQVLLNIVRLKYRDVPVFLEVTSVSTSLEFGAQFQPEVSIFEGPGNDGIDGAIGGVSYTEQPTITYLPLHGERFVRQLLTPIPGDDIELLYYSGWSIDRILRVCVQRFGPYRNAPSASGPTPDTAPEFEAFREVSRLLRVLQVAGGLSVGRARVGTAAGAAADGESSRSALVLELDLSVLDSSDRLALASMLELDAEASGPRRIVLNDGTATDELHEDVRTMTVVTRSVMAAMFYLSQGVTAPERDRAVGRVTVTTADGGAEFDWANLLGGLFAVHESEDEPGNAYTSVWYRDRWFFIDDSDRTSKSTFSLLNQLLALQAGELDSRGPVLTLPVAP